jgi:hypothetical protein
VVNCLEFNQIDVTLESGDVVNGKNLLVERKKSLKWKSIPIKLLANLMSIFAMQPLIIDYLT